MPTELSYGEALVAGLEEAMEQDRRIVLFNPSFVGAESGRDKIAALRKKYAARIKLPPIAEIGFCGIATGAAMAGLRPVVDISTATFSYEAIPQIINEAAIAYSNSGGQTNVPVVFYMKFGIRGAGGVQHSGSPQSWYWNTPGLQIVMPSTPADAKGLMRTVALKSENPTVFFGHDRLLETRGSVPDGAHEVPLGKADVKRQGKDLTIIATSIQVPRALAAADILAKEGVSAEVIDPRCLQPLDKPALLASVKKTGRVLITDESHDNCGIAAGLAAIVADEGFASLRAPIKRVSIPPVPVPYSVPLEDYVTPMAPRIVEAARLLVA